MAIILDPVNINDNFDQERIKINLITDQTNTNSEDIEDLQDSEVDNRNFSIAIAIALG